MAAFILAHPWPGTAVNVNIPALPEGEIKGVAVVKQGRTRLLENFERRVDPRDNIYYWLAGETQLAADESPDADACALRQGYITITPLHSDLTRYDLLDEFGARVKHHRETLFPAVPEDGDKEK